MLRSWDLVDNYSPYFSAPLMIVGLYIFSCWAHYNTFFPGWAVWKSTAIMRNKSQLCLSLSHFICLLRCCHIAFHPACSKDTNQASHDQSWYTSNQKRQGEVLASPIERKVL